MVSEYLVQLRNLSSDHQILIYACEKGIYFFIQKMRLHANTFTITNVSILKFNNNAVLQGEEKCIKIFTLLLTLDKQRKLSLNNSRESSRSFELDQTTFHRKCKNVIQNV